jgi:outer membrane receptor protein involved in Fe transport
VPLNLSPEDIENYEGGLKGSLYGGRLSLEASYFYMNDEGVVLRQRQGPFFLDTNAGERKFKGFETGLGWTPVPEVTTYLNASFYRNRFGEFVIESSGGDTVLTGNHLVLAPDYITNWGVNVNPVPSIDLTLDVKRQSVRQRRLVALTPTPSSTAATWRQGPLQVTLSAGTCSASATDVGENS